MKKTSFLFIFAAIAAFMLINFSCKRDKIESPFPQDVKGILYVKKNSFQNGETVLIKFSDTISGKNVKIETSVKDSILKSTLFLQDDKTWVEVSTFNLSLESQDYRRKMNSLVKEKATTLKNKFELSKLAEISNILDAVPDILYNKIGRKDFINESVSSIFYHMGVVNTARRASENNSEDCHCTINPTYIMGDAPFACAQDRFISPETALKIATKISNGRNF